MVLEVAGVRRLFCNMTMSMADGEEQVHHYLQ